MTHRIPAAISQTAAELQGGVLQLFLHHNAGFGLKSCGMKMLAYIIMQGGASDNNNYQRRIWI